MEDEQEALELIKNKPWLFNTLHYSLRDSYDFVLKAVKQDGAVLEYIDSVFRDDYDMVYESAMQQSRGYQYASDRMHSDPDIARIVLHHKNCSNYLYISSHLTQSKDFLLWVAGSVEAKCSGFYSYLFKILEKSEFMDARQYLMKVISVDDCAYEHAPDALRDDKDIALHAVRKNSFSLRHVSKRLIDDYEIILAALKADEEFPQALIGMSSERIQDLIMTTSSTKISAMTCATEAIEILQRALDSSNLNEKLQDSLKPRHESKPPRTKL